VRSYLRTGLVNLLRGDGAFLTSVAWGYTFACFWSAAEVVLDRRACRSSICGGTLSSSGFPFATITQIAVEPNASATASVTFSGFNTRHVFQTTDGGLNWKDISGDLPNIPVNDIVIDPDQADALYLATDLGVFQTTDGGTTWNPLGGGLPNVAVLGLKLYEPSRTLRAATHGRSAWDFSLGPAGPSLSISPAELKFKDRLIGTTSAARTVTVFNTTTSGIVLTVTSVSISGTNSNDFNIVTNTCTTPVVPGASCSYRSPSPLHIEANALLRSTYRTTLPIVLRRCPSWGKGTAQGRRRIRARTASFND
jgi:hypothetical protein